MRTESLSKAINTDTAQGLKDAIIHNVKQLGYIVFKDESNEKSFSIFRVAIRKQFLQETTLIVFPCRILRCIIKRDTNANK